MLKLLVKSVSEVGGQTAAVLYSVVGTCKHLGIDLFAYLRDALPGLFALGKAPKAEQLLDWLPDRWLWNRTRINPSETCPLNRHRSDPLIADQRVRSGCTPYQRVMGS
jgi:hypothetical protein